MAKYLIVVVGQKVDRAIDAGPHAADSAKTHAKQLCSLYKDNDKVLIYRWNVVWKRWESWHGFRWEESRKQVERALVTKAEWDANEPKT